MSVDHPVITVVTITLNAERFLTETMESVLAQQGCEIEYLLIDGGSTDGTLTVIRDHATVDNRIRWVSAPDGGISSALNKGVDLAEGEIIAFLHADDFYPDIHILQRVSMLFENNPDQLWITGGMYQVDEGGRNFRTIPARRFSFARLLRNNILLHPATFVRKEAFIRAGQFSTAYSYAMDYDFWLRLAAIQNPLTIDCICASFRVHPGSRSTADIQSTLAEEWHIRRKYLANPFVRVFHCLYYQLKRFGCRINAKTAMCREGAQ